jgi:hypothetical protein
VLEELEEPQPAASRHSDIAINETMARRIATGYTARVALGGGWGLGGRLRDLGRRPLFL